MLNNLLFYRFTILNILIAVGFAAVGYKGWITAFVENDRSYISLFIIAIFSGAWIYQGIKTWTVSKRINAFKYATKTDILYSYKESILPVEKLTILRDKDLTKISWMNKVAGWLVFVGLIGTVIGFIIALSGVPESGLSGEEGVEGIQESVGMLIAGMYIALFTTLAGSVAGLIIEVNAAMIRTALYNHWADLIVRLGK